MSPLTVDVVWDPKDIQPLRDDWERLFRDGKNEPSTSYEWATALIKNHLRATDRLFIVVIKHNGVTVCLAPIVASEERALGQTFIRLSPLSERNNTHGALLSCHDEAECASVMLSTLYSLDIRWDVFRMSKILEDQPLLEGIEGHLKLHGKKSRVQYFRPSFFMALPDSFAEYLTQRSGKFRNYLRRAEKKLNTLGEVTTIEKTDPRGLEDAYEQILYVERNSWKHEHGTAISAVARQTGFYRDLCRGAAEAGRLHLSFLYLANEPIAYNLGYLHDNRYYYLKTSYHEQYRSYGAATYSRARLIESLIDQGIRFFDFPGEPYEWEQQWADMLRWHKSVAVYNDTLRARAYYFLSRARNFLQGPAAGKKLRFFDARELRPPEN